MVEQSEDSERLAVHRAVCSSVGLAEWLKHTARAGYDDRLLGRLAIDADVWRGRLGQQDIDVDRHADHHFAFVHSILDLHSQEEVCWCPLEARKEVIQVIDS